MNKIRILSVLALVLSVAFATGETLAYSACVRNKSGACYYCGNSVAPVDPDTDCPGYCSSVSYYSDGETLGIYGTGWTVGAADNPTSVSKTLVCDYLEVPSPVGGLVAMSVPMWVPFADGCEWTLVDYNPSNPNCTDGDRFVFDGKLYDRCYSCNTGVAYEWQVTGGENYVQCEGNKFRASPCPETCFASRQTSWSATNTTNKPSGAEYVGCTAGSTSKFGLGLYVTCTACATGYELKTEAVKDDACTNTLNVGRCQLDPSVQTCSKDSDCTPTVENPWDDYWVEIYYSCYNGICSFEGEQTGCQGNSYLGEDPEDYSTVCIQCPATNNGLTIGTVADFRDSWGVNKCCLPGGTADVDATGTFEYTSQCCAS